MQHILGCIAGNKLLRMPLIVKEQAGLLDSQDRVELACLRDEKSNLYGMLAKVGAEGQEFLDWEKKFLERAADLWEILSGYHMQSSDVVHLRRHRRHVAQAVPLPPGLPQDDLI